MTFSQGARGAEGIGIEIGGTKISTKLLRTGTGTKLARTELTAAGLPRVRIDMVVVE